MGKATTANRLSAVAVKALMMPGKYHDGGGLYLQVQSADRRSWLYRFTREGKQREMGLGAYPEVSLAVARTKAEDARRDLRQGEDPLDKRRAERNPQRPRPQPTTGMTFREAATAVITAKQAGWSNGKHADQWTATLTTYAYPTLGNRVAKEISSDDVLAVLTPIWTTKPETACPVRGRIESVLNYAAMKEAWESWTNPATWRGRLEHMLASRSKVAPVEHHAALPFADLPAFMTLLRLRDGRAGQALQFCILTAARSGMVLGATWSEIDTQARVWTIPAARMKAGRHHRAPLT